MQSNWYEQFFHGLALEFWRRAVTEEQTRSDVDFIVKGLRLEPGAHTLDIPSGNGRHSLELAGRGYQTTGIDLSADFIHEAREAAAANEVEAEWIVGDMRHISLPAKFDGAFCFGNSFGYFSHEDTMGFLRATARCLKTGARFIVDTGLAAESLLPNLVQRRWFQFDDLLMLSEGRYVAAESRLQTQYTFIRGEVRQTETAVYSVYTVAEIKRLLSGNGFEVEHLLGTPQGDPYEVGNPRLFVIARKAN